MTDVSTLEKMAWMADGGDTWIMENFSKLRRRNEKLEALTQTQQEEIDSLLKKIQELEAQIKYREEPPTEFIVKYENLKLEE